jgi:hypothetical protein
MNDATRWDEDWGADDDAAPSGSGWDAVGDPRVQAGIEHLQRAAREMIAASRALLDAAEDLVEDPKAAAGIVEMLGSLAARRVPGRGGAAPGGDDDDLPPVQRIPVS